MYYKQILNIIIFTLISLSSFASLAQEIDFADANLAYEKGDFENAIKKYNFLIENGHNSESINFNLANAYFKNKEIGKSILYYERVLKQNPNNRDALQNLAFVKTKLDNELLELPDLFFVTWWKKLIHFFDADTWAWISVAFFWFALIAFIFFLFFKNISFRKAAFTKTIIFSFIALFSFLITKIKTGQIFNYKEIVLVKENSISKSAPSFNSDDNFTFYEGTKLKVEDQVESFYKVEDPDGNLVWVNKEDFGEI